MAPQAVVPVTQAWLQSTWHVRVPFAWLEACVAWLQEEAGGADRLSQQQINQQALDQWLLTDLKNLDYPVLPEGLAQAHKTQLSGTFCVQVDSLLDISQPAYGQLQQRRGTDCANDDVSAVTQSNQRSWEARPTRMLLLQVTDGVQSLEAMEYQPIPALSTALRPGVKLQLQGQMICKLGMLLLGPGNVKVLGGEVEDLAENNNQGRILCRVLGLPEEQQQQEEEVRGEAPPTHQDDATNQGGQDIELDDLELLAGLEGQEELQQQQEQEEVEVVERLPVRPVQDSGYRTLSQFSTQFSRTSNVRSLSASSSRSEASMPSNVSGFNAFPNGRRNNEQEQSDVVEPSPSRQGPAWHGDDNDDFPDEDFVDLVLDNMEEGPQYSFRSAPPHEPSVDQDGGDVMEDMDFSAAGIESYGGRAQDSESGQLHGNEIVGKESVLHMASHASMTAGAKTDPPGDITLTSPPFTYLCLLDEISTPTSITIKAFIVTLLGKLNASDGLWRIRATLSDGSGYLDAELSDRVLTGLLGFTVAEKGAMRRDPARRSQLDAGMRRCQEELVDMCCLITVEVGGGGGGGGAVVTQAEPVTEGVCRELEQRVRDRK
ncbi:recQ-mediated genome instability protein 1 isoform X2 [Phyllopteryx taeniolatus]|uniref:recQ-mediated genome instability protein 1 isoform X2 n=1 Tax=Phyllopteryx taeniolatus TaxID=161469 RepID=UPI002AD3D97C|nr:recQ-mediated genome instability protein 1 isoform X2 [Phyllopteryx taeniolatus]